MRAVVPFAEPLPDGFAQWSWAIDFALAPVVEVAIVGDPEDAATAALIVSRRGGFRPNRVLAVTADPAASALPLMAASWDRWPADRLRLPRSPAACR